MGIMAALFRPAADALARIDRPGHRDQPSALVGHPFLQQLDLGRAEAEPVRIEGHHAIVIVHFLAGRGEIGEHLARLLRHARFARLQEYVQRGRVVAIESLRRKW